MRVRLQESWRQDWRGVSCKSESGLRTHTKESKRLVMELRRSKPATGLGSSRELDGPVYISVDMDVLDPAFAPGISHHEPGGLTTRELINAIQSINVPVVAVDVVELNPRRDRDDVTAVCAAKIMRELAAVIVRSN